jgi:preprotein translocase subunit SecE
VKSKTNIILLRKDQETNSKGDMFKWFLCVVLLLVALVGNYRLGELSVPVRTAGWIAIFIVAGWIASTTRKGLWVFQFFRDARLELRKVVWPTRQEVGQTTLVVVAMVAVLALILWGIDGVLVWLIGLLTGQRG